MDIFTAKKRSKIMSKIKGHDTGLEVRVCELLRGMGHKFERHVKSLPGCPDIVIRQKKKILFANGCFWHGHRNCSRAKLPATNRKFWEAKINGNMKRDLRIKRQLRSMGWTFLEIWGCKTSEEYLSGRLERFMPIKRATS